MYVVRCQFPGSECKRSKYTTISHTNSTLNLRDDLNTQYVTLHVADKQIWTCPQTIWDKRLVYEREQIYSPRKYTVAEKADGTFNFLQKTLYKRP